MKIGDLVRVAPRKKDKSAMFHAIVTAMDSDDCIGNPEEFVTVKREPDHALFSFRRPEGSTGSSWAPRSKTLLAIKGDWKIELGISSSADGGPRRG